MIDSLLIVSHVFSMPMFPLLSVDKILLLNNVNWCSNFIGLPFTVGLAPSCLKHMKYVLSALT